MAQYLRPAGGPQESHPRRSDCTRRPSEESPVYRYASEAGIPVHRSGQGCGHDEGTHSRASLPAEAGWAQFGLGRTENQVGTERAESGVRLRHRRVRNWENNSGRRVSEEGWGRSSRSTGSSWPVCGRVWWQRSLLSNLGGSESVVHRFRRRRGGTDTFHPSTNLAGAISCTCEQSATRDTASRNSGSDARAHVARNRRGPRDDCFGEAASAGARGYALGGSILGGSHLIAGAAPRTWQADADWYLSPRGSDISEAPFEGGQARSAGSPVVS